LCYALALPAASAGGLASVESPAGNPVAAREWKITLWLVLQALVVGLMLTVVPVLGAIGFRSDRRIIAALGQEIVRVTARDVSNRVGRLLEAGTRTARDLDLRATYGRLPLADDEQLATFLGDRLRYEPGIARLFYGDATTGAVVTVGRTPTGGIAATIADHDVKAGRPRTWCIEPDGSRTPYDLSTPVEVDARERPWFRAAEQADGVRWTGLYIDMFKVPSIAVAAPVRDPRTDALRGVWAAQFHLDALPAMLHEACGMEPDVRVMLLTREGRLVASSQASPPELVAATAAALPQPIADLPQDMIHELRFEVDSVEWVGGAERFTAGGELDWIVAYCLPEQALLQSVYDKQKTNAAVSLTVLGIGLAIGAMLASRIASPLRLIAADLGRVARFEFSATPEPASFVEEVAVIADTAERMKASLRSFARYVPTDVVRGLLASGEEAQLGGEMRQISLHFSDIEGFTTISERLSPPQVVEYLAEYLELMTAAIRAEGGIVNQVIGDGILGLFNAPAPLVGHAAANCRAALAAQQALGDLRSRWQPLGRPLLRARIGLHVGDVMVGNFGTHEHLAYGVIGDAVNLSSRLEGLNKAYGTSIVASEDLRTAAGSGFEWRTLDRVAVVGRTGGTLVCELLGHVGSVTADALAARDGYERALADYFAGRFDRAAAGFRDLSTARPVDQAATTLAERAEALARRPPERWDGVHLVASK